MSKKRKHNNDKIEKKRN